ncbi:ribonuclease H-like domain-containing protein [Halosolutus amylolyticus]|uniref:Ribonuclease H-like domain-containing protein n=1 Tax=Halosolutus amylolyticus TaxID=2932267 RepID=A0ABD5PJQ6_9EURY|nr:ribonuclease H-like domain-containing protein [Halosolutus amylolyticus]
MSELTLVAFDIETTGFSVDDEVTVAGFAFPLGVRVFVQTGGRDAGGVAEVVKERVECHVQLSTHASERALLEAVGEFSRDRLAGDDVLLAAFNGETWRSGFDLPFLRTRLTRNDVAWPFDELPYTDLLPLVSKRFNTTVGEDECRDLVGVYDTLCGGSAGELDPFEECSEAVTAFENSEFTPLVLHNAADVLRARELGLLAERYCSKSDFKLKSLTSTRYG